MKKIIFWIPIFLIAIFLLTFKFLKVPPGIETDEGSIAYNAALISKTLRDQNNRFLPFFILSTDKMDWKQPVIIYSSALFFKLFGISLPVFKLVNIVTALASLYLMCLLLRKLFTEKLAFVGAIIFVTTPIFVIASRIGTEAISPLFFATSWLLSLALYQKNRKSLFLITSALSLGIGFYSYKGMRLIVPPWAVLTGVYIYLLNLGEVSGYNLVKTAFNTKIQLSLLTFFIILLPFFLITPILESKYAGAIFDRRQFSLESYRHYIYYWLSNLELSFLFLQGNGGKIFPVEMFGTLSLGALPFFLVGIKRAVEKINFHTFIFFSFVVSPAFFGLAGSIEYGHRLVAVIPSFVILTTLGISVIYEYIKSNMKHSPLKKLAGQAILVILTTFFITHTLNFVRYYFFIYPSLHETKEAFGNTLNTAFYKLSQISINENLASYIQDDVYNGYGDGVKFFEAAYFKKPLHLWKLGQTLPPHSILITQVKQIEGLTTVDIDAKPLYILKSE
ncbi:MAG: glycosyltransferase family 39 protein [Patescibacteria group bacterium]